MSPVAILNGGPLDGERVQASGDEYLHVLPGECRPSKEYVPMEGFPLLVVKPATALVYRRVGPDHFSFEGER